MKATFRVFVIAFLQYWPVTPTIAQSYTELKKQGDTEREDGRPWLALEKYSLAIDYIQNKQIVESPEFLGDLYFRAGQACLMYRDYDRASLLLNEAAQHLSKGTPTDQLKECFIMIAEVNLELGAFDESLNWINKTLRLMPDKKALAKCSRIKGRVYSAQGNAAKAIEEYKLAIKAHKQSTDCEDLVTVYKDLMLELGTEESKEKKQIDKSLKQEILDCTLLVPPPNLGAVQYYNLNSMFAATYNEALANLDNAIYFNKKPGLSSQALESFKKHFPGAPGNYYEDYLDLPALLDTYCLKGVIYFYIYSDAPNKNLSDIQNSIKYFQKADSLLQAIRTTMLTEKNKLALSSTSAYLHADGVKSALTAYEKTNDPQYKKIAFDFIENSKSSVLKNAMIEARAKVSSEIPDSLLLKETRIKKEIFALASTKNQDQVSQSKISSLSSQLNSLHALFKERYPRYDNLRRGGKTTNLEEIQKTMGTSSALIEYLIGSESLYIAVITNKTVELVTVPIDETFEKNIRAFRKTLIFRLGNDFKNISAKLHETLIKPVQTLLAKQNQINKLYIIPDGILGYIPFEALLSNGSVTGKYLVNQYEISYPISASALEKLAPSENAQGGYIALAPVFQNGNNTNFLVKSCDRSYEGTLLESNFQRAFAQNGKTITPLPGTEKEVVAISTKLKNQNLFVKFFIHQDAREEIIKAKDFSNYQYIHLATHGIVNDQYPEFSGLLLSQDTASAEDGILYNGEIYTLKLNADLVVLSACETGLGKIVNGEGIMGLSRGWIYAGAKNLVVSLWKVDDASTTELMINFYNELLTGKSKEEALRIAKTKLIASAEYSDPYFWAPFVLIKGN